MYVLHILTVCVHVLCYPCLYNQIYISHFVKAMRHFGYISHSSIFHWPLTYIIIQSYVHFITDLNEQTHSIFLFHTNDTFTLFHTISYTAVFIFSYDISFFQSFRYHSYTKVKYHRLLLNNLTKNLKFPFSPHSFSDRFTPQTHHSYIANILTALIMGQTHCNAFKLFSNTRTTILVKSS